MATYNGGQVKFGTPGGNTVDSANLSTRRLYDFSDRVADLSPEESPFFVYLSKEGKVPTSDSQIRFLEVQILLFLIQQVEMVLIG